MCFSFVGFGQKDTIYTIEESFESQVKLNARDSIVNHFKRKQIELFGEASLQYEGIDLKADYMLVDLEKKEVLATYTLDKDSNRVGMPVFSDGSEQIDAASIRYNFETKKGYIQEVKIKQDENYLYMGVAKRQTNEEVHFKQGKFTTCDLEEPHYHFQLSRAILVPEKRIVSGPMNLWIKGVPTPIGLPFIFIPQKKPNERSHGFLFPEIVPFSSLGSGFQNLGYYIPINDSIHTTLFANAFTRGSWGLGNKTSYKIKYKFEGNTELRYEEFRAGFPVKGASKKTTIIWNHRQDVKANPYWNFSSAVNFISNNDPKQTTDPLDKNYFNNNFNSDINLNRFFPGKPVTMGLKASLKQSTQTRNYSVTLPTFSTNITRFYPLKGLVNNQVGSLKPFQKFISEIGMTYNMEARNATTFRDSLLIDRKFDSIAKTFQNGINQNTTIQTTLGLFKNALKITPSVQYTNKVNFQQIRKSYDETTNNTVIDTIRQVGMAQNLRITANATTILYGYYQFVGKKKPLVRHLLTPSVGFSYVPQLNKLITDSVGFNKQPITYSPFERSMYAEGATKSAGFINFGINNTFELKRKSEKDTITGYKKTRLIDALSINGNYDIFRDSFNLSNLSLNLRINPVDYISFVADASFSPYAWIDSSGKQIKEYAWKNDQGLGRFASMNFNTTFTLAPKSSREKIQENKNSIQENWNADFQYYALHPELLLDFEIPWKIVFSHVYSLNVNTNKSSLPGTDNRNYLSTQTLTANGDVSITKRWKVASMLSYDLTNQQFANTRFTLTRNMHCWNLSFFWNAIGTNQSFVFRLNATSALFQDAKLELRQPPQLF